jgi:predicted metal-dependent enzyme (double-stranded beta helix superfamily)
MDGPKLMDGLRESLAKVLASDLTEIGVKREGNHIDESRYLYYDGEIYISFDHLPKGKYVPPHDHGVWEAMGIYSGQLNHALFERKDDGTKEGFADLEMLDDRMLETGDMMMVAPPSEIHSFTALTDDTWSVTIVGGHYKPDRNYFDPENKSYVRRNSKDLKRNNMLKSAKA